jgi:anti-sigma B factor antagonist
VSGELDVSNAEELREAIVKTEAAAPELLMLDLSALEFMDASGLHAVWEAQRRASSDGCRLVLIRPPAPVFRVFEITGMDTRFEFT